MCAETVIRALVEARDESLHNEARHKFHVRKLCDDIRLEKFSVILQNSGHRFLVFFSAVFGGALGGGWGSSSGVFE